MMNKRNLFGMIGALGGLGAIGPTFKEPKPKRKQICPNCGKEHTTGKAYCSAECCKAVRRLS